MGTHPIFESDFDCLTDNKSDSHPRTLHGWTLELNLA